MKSREATSRALHFNSFLRPVVPWLNPTHTVGRKKERKAARHQRRRGVLLHAKPSSALLTGAVVFMSNIGSRTSPSPRLTAWHIHIHTWPSEYVGGQITPSAQRRPRPHQQCCDEPAVGDDKIRDGCLRGDGRREVLRLDGRYLFGYRLKKSKRRVPVAV